MAVLQTALLAVGVAVFFGLISYLVFYLPVRNKKSLPPEKRKDLRNFFLIMVGFGFFFGAVLGGPAIQTQNITQNEKIVRANVSQKYKVEEITFGPRGRGVHDVAYPEQSETQKITIKALGKTRLAVLTQDEKTSEPTLTDVDNGQPMDDILKAKQ